MEVEECHHECKVKNKKNEVGLGARLGDSTCGYAYFANHTLQLTTLRTSVRSHYNKCTSNNYDSFEVILTDVHLLVQDNGC